MSRRSPLFEGINGEDRVAGAHRVDDVDLDITPMIDVTFLLLIFFIVTSTMQATPTLDMPPAKHGIGVPSQQATIVTIQSGESSGDPPVIILGDGSGPQGTFDEVRRYVEEGLKENQIEVIVKADRDVPYGFVQKVLKTIAEIAQDIQGLKYSIGVQDDMS